MFVFLLDYCVYEYFIHYQYLWKCIFRYKYYYVRWIRGWDIDTRHMWTLSAIFKMATTGVSEKSGLKKKIVTSGLQNIQSDIDIQSTRFAFDNTAAQSQNAVSLYFTKTHVLHFAILEQNTAWYMYLEWMRHAQWFKKWGYLSPCWLWMALLKDCSKQIGIYERSRHWLSTNNIIYIVVFSSTHP